MGSMAFGLIGAGISALSAFTGSMAQGARQRRQAEDLEARAADRRALAKVEAARGQVEAENIGRRRREVTRKFNEVQAANRVSLGAGNVEMSSGSAADVSEGNILNYSADVGDNAYARMMKEWETARNVNTLNRQAEALDNRASYLQRTAANFGASLLNAGISGGLDLLKGYAPGGRLGSLFNFGGAEKITEQEIYDNIYGPLANARNFGAR